MTSSSHPSVVVVSGAASGTTLSIDEVLADFTIGSDDGCHLVLSGDAISPAHAALFLDDEGQVSVSDTKSRDGVFVNGARITEKILVDGDEISIGPPDDPGSARLRFDAQGSQAPLVDLSEPEAAEMSGLDDLASLDLLENNEPEFAVDSAEFEDPGHPDSTSLSLPDAPSLPFEEFPPLEMDSVPELEPSFVEAPPAEVLPAEVPPVSAPAPPPAAEPPPVAAPKPPVQRTEAIPGAGPQPVSAQKPTTKRIVSADSDDPLAGLAESLGSTGRQKAPSPSPKPRAPAATGPGATGKVRKIQASLALKATRLGIIAVVLSGLAWFGYRQYAVSIVPPVIDTYQPNPAEPGQTLTINGSGFGGGPRPSVVKVTLGPAEAQVLDSSPTRINVVIPETLAESGSQSLTLTVATGLSASTSRLLKIAVTPRISSLTPRVALSGDEVSIAGKWLASPQGKPRVTVAGNEADVLEATASLIRIKVPAVAASEGQKVALRVVVGSDLSKESPLYFGRLPFVESVTPLRARPGEIATIAGLGLLGPDLFVVVGGKSAAVVSVTDAEIKMSVPGLRLSEGAGRRDVIVRVNQKESLAHSIEILHQSSALYSPRFFVEIIQGSRVAIACELGPVMVLGGDVPSRKRAHDAATRLNELASQGRASRVQFTASDTLISASGGPVLAVAAGDGSGNPRGLASLWAAHLTDIFDLFFQGRRPGRTVELSPDGKVFLDIFAAARRRSAEPGVAQGILFSPDPSWLRSFASLAAAPTMSGSQALALLDGYWSGVIEVPGAIQPRKLEISLTATSSGLIGQQTSRQGRLSTDVTLRNLSYARRELRFSFVETGETLTYQGRLDGDVIEGNVTKASGAKVGRLALKLTR
jgi:hypothetical protein